MILQRYVILALLRGILVTLAVLVLLVSFAALVKELDDVGKGQYGIPEALAVVGLTMPERILDLFSVSALVGGIIGLGGLVASQELLAARAAGFSPRRLAGTALRAAVPLIVLVGVLAEFVVPPLSQEAARTKRLAVGGPDATVTDDAIWLKDGNSIVRIGQVREGDQLEEVTVFKLDASARLREVVSAREGLLLSGHRWRLSGVRRQALPTGAVIETETWDGASPVGPDTLRLLVSPVDLLPVSRLWNARSSDDSPGEEANIQRALWRRLVTPFLLAAMLVLAVPFAVRRGPTQRLGARLAAGAIIGVLAHLGIQAVSYLGALLELDPPLVAMAPVAVTALVSGVLVARLQ